jgi:hypothetical protein
VIIRNFKASQVVRWFLLLWVWSATALAAITPTAPPREYQIKAVFLYNFAQFVEWPPAAFQDTLAPLIIGVLGEDSFGIDLDAAAGGEKAGDRPIEVRRFRRIEEVGTCHILFISRSEIPRFDLILGALRGRSILTVGDFQNFSVRGGMIHFVMENNRVRMRINLEAAKHAGLSLSSKLLRSAQIVNGKGN